MATILFGGSFNPVHLGHFAMAKAALERFPNASLIWMPAACSPFKTNQPLAGEEHRFEMCRIMVQNDTRMQVSDLEFTLDKPSYTIHTVRRLMEQKQDDFYFLCGADSYLSLFGWKEIESLAQMVTFLVVNRKGNDSSLLKEQEKNLQAIGGRTVFLFMDEYPVSSTELRRQLSKGNYVSGLHPDVFRYIQENNLYKE